MEDQVTPKRCGHFDGKRVISAQEMELKIRVAVDARSDENLVILARTDARQKMGLEEAIDRVNRYCEAGADMAFVEAPESLWELEEIPRRVSHPLLSNMLTGGVTPILSVQELEELGYKLAVCPIESLMVTAKAMRELCDAMMTQGRVDRFVSDTVSFSELKKLLGADIIP